MNEPENPGRADSTAAELAAQELGALIRRAREASGLTQEDVAGQLFLNAELIRKVDDGRLENVPSPTYMKGYLRSYARLVGLSGDEVVERYSEIEKPPAAQSVQLPDVTQEQVGSVKLTGPVATTGLYGLAAIAVILVLIWGLSLDESPNDGVVPNAQVAGPDAALDSVEEAPPQNDDPDAALRMATLVPEVTDDVPPQPGAGVGEEAAGGDSSRTITGDQVQIEIGGDENAWRRIDALGNANTDGEEFAAAPAVTGEEAGVRGTAVSDEVKIERRTEGDKRFIEVRAGGRDHLQFLFDGACWLKVSDGHSRSVYADLHRRGDVVDLYGQAPFKVLVGRAQSVTILFNDRPVELIPNALDNTARIELGSPEAR